MLEKIQELELQKTNLIREIRLASDANQLLEAQNDRDQSMIQKERN
jgi:hypothetical protein